MAERLAVPKTFKLYIGGKFPRTKSGRTIRVAHRDERIIAHVGRASRDDLAAAVAAARGAQGAWANATAYLRGQIMYRMAEMLDGKHEEFTSLLASTVPGGIRRARKEVGAAVDRLVCFAGWTDKFSHVLAGCNPVAGPYDNVTVPEAVGVTAVIAPDEEPLLALVSLIAPPLCVGNTIVALGSGAHPLATCVFGEVCATSDVPPGVVNLLTGMRSELIPHIAHHRDIDAIHAANLPKSQRQVLRAGAAENIKRVTVHKLAADAWYDDNACHNPWLIEPFVEMKTTWRPVGA
ncbi:MAG: aldehyde dehydrogenase family protein [Phycisphaerales bacterium]|nr:aldehyde dehydrogenase family protein [Phycisphaerales bacterium]